MFGRAALDIDKSMRNFEFEKVSWDQLENFTPEVWEIFESFTKGVNAYVDQAWFLPIEFWILNLGFEKWTAFDSVIVYTWN